MGMHSKGKNGNPFWPRQWRLCSLQVHKIPLLNQMEKFFLDWKAISLWVRNKDVPKQPKRSQNKPGNSLISQIHTRDTACEAVVCRTVARVWSLGGRGRLWRVEKPGETRSSS